MEEIRSNKPFIIIIVILIIIIIALGAFIFVDKTILNKKEEVKTTKIKDVEIDLNAMFKISDTLNRLDNTFNDNNSSLLGYIYNQKKLDAKKFDTNAALFLSLHDDLIDSNSNQVISGTQVKRNFNNIFGNSLIYTPNNIDGGNIYKIGYDQATDSYTYILAPTVKNNNIGYKTYNVKTILEKGNVILTRKVFYMESTDNINASIYVDSSKQKLLGTIKLKNGVLSEEEVIGKYGSKINTYQYTFQQNASDDYSFDSIIKIN